jgi:predicted nucleic acid-binding protein
MPRLMLDTNICIHAIKRNEPKIVSRLERTRPQDVAISSIVAAELWTGVMKSRERQRNERALREFLAFVAVLDWPGEAARIYGAGGEGSADRRDGPAHCGPRHSRAGCAGDAESRRVWASRRSANRSLGLRATGGK